MKEGAWIEAGTGRWHWIDEHANWIRKPGNATKVGLSEEVALRLASMPRKQMSGAERDAILLEAMRHGLIRFRGHGSTVTFEMTIPLETAILAVSGFMREHFGALTTVRFNQLDDGLCLECLYQDLLRAIEIGDPVSTPSRESHREGNTRSSRRMS